MTSEAVNEFLNAARQAGWQVESREVGPLILPPEILARIAAIPDDLVGYLEEVRTCVNSTEDAWFLCESDYVGTSASGTGFRWNEWEIMSLDCADGDPDETAAIRQFWRNVMPIAFSVSGDYGYIGIETDGPFAGRIVKGYSPEFEEPLTVAASYVEPMKRMSQALRNPESAPDLRSFL